MPLKDPEHLFLCVSSAPCSLSDYRKAVLGFICHLAYSVKSSVIKRNGDYVAMLPGPAVLHASRNQEWLVFHLFFRNKA